MRKKKSLPNPIKRWWWLFLGPVVAAFAIGFVWPFLQGIYLSFCKFRLVSDAQFIGIDNYLKAFSDASFVHSFWYSALFAVVSLVLINVLAFAAAYALTLERLEVSDAKVTVVDKGALDCTLKARVECAVFRSCGQSEANIPWGGAVR